MYPNTISVFSGNLKLFKRCYYICTVEFDLALNLGRLVYPFDPVDPRCSCWCNRCLFHHVLELIVEKWSIPFMLFFSLGKKRD